MIYERTPATTQPAETDPRGFRIRERYCNTVLLFCSQRDLSLFRPTKNWGPADKSSTESGSIDEGGKDARTEFVVSTNL